MNLIDLPLKISLKLRKKLDGDDALHLVPIGFFESAIELREAFLMPCSCIVRRGALEGVHFPYGSQDSLFIILREGNPLDFRRYGRLEFPFADVSLIALPISRLPATIVDIAATLLFLARENRSTCAAGEGVAENEKFLAHRKRLCLTGWVLRVKPERFRDERLMLAGVDLSLILDLSCIDAILNHFVELVFRHTGMGRLVEEPLLAKLSGDSFQGIETGCSKLKKLADEWRSIGVDLQLALHHPIAVWSSPAPATLFEFLLDTFFGLIPQVVDEVLRDENLHSPRGFLRRGHVRPEDAPGLHQVEAHSILENEFIYQDEIVEVPGEAIGLLDQDHLGGIFGFQGFDHVAELDATSLSCSFAFGELLSNAEAVLLSVASHEVQLSRDGKPFLFLGLAGNTCVDDGGFHGIIPQEL